MSSAETTYYKPTTVAEACELLADIDDSTIVAGNQSLGLMIKEGVITPNTLIDIKGVKELQGIDRTSDGLRIGALTTHRAIETSDTVADTTPVFAEAAGRIADVQIRNAGTVGGATAYADPTGDYPPVFLALDATIVTRTTAGESTYTADEFFVGYYESALNPDELVTEIQLPIIDHASGEGAGFGKLAYRENDRAIVNAAAYIRLAEGTCTIARIGVGGVADRPILADGAANRLVDSPVDEAAVDAAATAAKNETPVLPDPSIGEAYRADMVEHFVREAIQTARNRAGGGV